MKSYDVLVTLEGSGNHPRSKVTLRLPVEANKKEEAEIFARDLIDSELPLRCALVGLSMVGVKVKASVAK